MARNKMLRSVFGFRLPIFRVALRLFTAGNYWILAASGCAAQAFLPLDGPQKTIYQDIYWIEQADRITFGNAGLQLQISKREGNWLSLAALGVPGSLITPSDKSTGIDFRVDDQLMIAKAGARVLSYTVSVDKRRNGAFLSVVLGIPSLAGKPANAPAYAYELTCEYRLFPGRQRLERSAQLVRKSRTNHADVVPQRFGGFVFQVPGVQLGNLSDCVVNVPGPFFPDTYLRPDSPYDSLTHRSMSFHSAPDAGFGVLALGNESLRKTLAAWMDTGGEVNYRPEIRGDKKRLTFHHHDFRYYYLPEHTTVTSDTHVLTVADGSLADALAQYRDMVNQTFPLDPNTADWVRKMVLLEVYPLYFSGGIRGLTAKLPFYRSIGFNTIYLMPHWAGGYFPLDLFQVDPQVGSSEDLKTMVRTAHQLGMKVLFDMVIHGFSPKSSVVKQHPDLFVHDERGEPALHPTWKSVTTDWASSAYQQYMTDLVLHDLKTYDMDGYRVDAASFKGPGWDPNKPYPAYRSGTAAPELMQKMLQALRKVKPEAVLLNEVFGPVFYSVSNLGHDNQTEAVELLLEKMEKGEATALDYQKHLANVWDMLPTGANRVFFARNHDTSWFYHFRGYTPRFMAVEAIHAFFGIPEVFAGDPNHGPSPDDDPGVYSHYQKLFRLRAELPELTEGNRLLREVQADNPWVFTGLRERNKQYTLVAVSLSEQTEKVKLTFQSARMKSGREKPMLRDVMTGDTIECQGSNDGFFVQMKPFQVLVGQLP